MQKRLSQAAVDLAPWVDRQGSQEAAAALLHTDQSHLSRILRGSRRPGLELANRIHDVVGIAPRAWDQLSRRRAPPARAKAS